MWNPLKGLIGGGVKDAGEGVKSILEGVGGFASDLRSAITGELSPDMRGKLETLAINLESLAMQGQLKINEVEASHSNIFVAGWRPAVGWICAIAFGYQMVIHSLFTWLLLIFLPDVEAPPQLSLGELMPVLLGMLGLGGMRSYEKKHKVNDRH